MWLTICEPNETEAIGVLGQMTSVSSMNNWLINLKSSFACVAGKCLPEDSEDLESDTHEAS